jgi:hypothetical protein
VIDHEREEMLTMTEAAKRMPGRPNASSVWRWYTKGVRGVRLETIKCGAKRLTSTEAIARFIAASTAAADGSVEASRPRHETQVPRDRRLRLVDAELNRLGV